MTAQRRGRVLEAAMRCFARDSMRDVIAESGLSAGAVYRYFPSKASLVAAVVEPTLGSLHHVVENALRGGAVPPAHALPALLEQMLVVATTGPVDLTRVAVTARGEGLRDPDVHAVAARIYGDLRTSLAGAVRVWQGAGHVAHTADPTATAQVLFSTIAGFVLQRALLGDVDPSAYAGALGQLLGPTSPT